MARAIGLLEAFGLAEEYGSKALSVDEVLFMADARKRKGCRLKKNQLTSHERKRVIQLGEKCLKWKKEMN